MKCVRLTASPDLSVAPEAFRAIAATRHATETRLLDWNLAGGTMATHLFRVEGDREAVEADLAAAPEVVAADCVPADGDHFHVLVRMDTDQVPMLRSVFDALLRIGVLVVRPVVYRDGDVTATFVGEADALSATVSALPPAIDVTVHRAGTYHGGVGTAAATLSERQREALLAALDLGYYEVPSAATHEDVADRLGCAASTATEHLRKAEAKVIRAVMGEERV